MRATRFPHGDGFRVLVSHEDITDRRRAEHDRVLLSSAIQQSPSAVVITDTDGQIQYVNPKFTQITG